MCDTVFATPAAVAERNMVTPKKRRSDKASRASAETETTRICFGAASRLGLQKVAFSRAA